MHLLGKHDWGYLMTLHDVQHQLVFLLELEKVLK